jgi:uncharacterized membrane protein YccF (DUF307 family)
VLPPSAEGYPGDVWVTLLGRGTRGWCTARTQTVIFPEAVGQQPAGRLRRAYSGRIDGVRTLLNIIWLLLCGIWMALGYLLAGIICCLLIITIPFGLASFRIGSFALWPFGRTLVRRVDAGAPSVIGNVIWIIVAGLWLAIAHVLTAIALGLTIIGLPLALANLKLVPVSLTPLGRVIVPISD